MKPRYCEDESQARLDELYAAESGRPLGWKRVLALVALAAFIAGFSIWHAPAVHP